MKSLLATLAFVISMPAFASHPHDRVCVGTADLGAGVKKDVIVQWQIGRTYQTGDSATDPHELTIELSSCDGDYLDSVPCTIAKSKTATYQNSDLESVPAKLLTAEGQLVFDGKFIVKSETLKGKLANDDNGHLNQTTIKLSCVSQPHLKLETSDQDLNKN